MSETRVKLDAEAKRYARNLITALNRLSTAIEGKDEASEGPVRLVEDQEVIDKP